MRSDNPLNRLFRLPKFATALAGGRQSLTALVDQGVVSVTNFATGVIIGRACGKFELGAYALAWTLMTLAIEFSATLTTTPYTVFGPQLSREQRRLYLGSVFVHQLSVSVLFALTMGAGAILALRTGWLSPSLASVISATAFAILFISLREFIRRVSFAELKVGLALVIDLVTCLSQAVGVLLLLHFHRLTAARTYTLLGIACAFVSIGWLTFHRGAFHVDAGSCVQDLKRNWRFAKWVLGSWILATVAAYLYPWLLAIFHGTSVTGIWAACSTIVALGNPVSLGLGNRLGPQIHNTFATSGTEAMRRSVHRSSVLFLLLLSPIVLALVVGGGRIVTLVYGGAYAGNAAIVILLVLNMWVSAMTFPVTRGLFSLDHAKADMLINVVSVVLLFTAGIAAVKAYSALGAAATLLATSVVAGVMRIVVFEREVRQRIPEGRPDEVQLAVELGD